MQKMQKNLKKGFQLFSVIGLCAAMSACSPVGAAVGAGATLGIAAAQEGGLKVAVTDTAIRLQIHDAWFKHDIDMYRSLDMTVKESRVLITGTVENPDMRVDAVRLAWQADGVVQVINEINVANGHGVVGYVKDSLITSNLRTRLTLDKEVQSINYSIETVNGTVYLMGVAQNTSERNHVMDHARNIAYVDSVVSYVRLRGEVPMGMQETASN